MDEYGWMCWNKKSQIVIIIHWRKTTIVERRKKQAAGESGRRGKMGKNRHLCRNKGKELRQRSSK